MRPKQFCSIAKAILAVFVTFLLASVIVPAQARAQKFKVLHTFHGANGAGPESQLVRDAAGNIYGTTSAGGKGICDGVHDCGTAFKLDKTGRQVWLHNFTGKNGFGPMAGLFRDAAGNLYGTTVLGGDTNCYTFGCGTVFKLDKTGRETVLYEFKGVLDGWFPEALLVGDAAGNLYGTTYMGGTSGYGEVFKLHKTGKETILHSFAGPIDGGGDGAYPYTGAIRDTAGDLYGVTDGGGAYGGGAVYKIDTAGEETLLYSFSGGADGGAAISVLVADAAGNLYGTTQGGGNLACQGGSGCGVVFQVSPQPDGRWTETTLYTFCSLANCTDGREPDQGPLTLDAAGNLYGTTYFGGTSPCNGSGCGLVFKLDSTGKETVLHSFTGGVDGAFPPAGVIIDQVGNLYGTTAAGGDRSCALGNGAGCGVVFRLTP